MKLLILSFEIGYYRIEQLSVKVDENMSEDNLNAG